MNTQFTPNNTPENQHLLKHPNKLYTTSQHAISIVAFITLVLAIFPLIYSNSPKPISQTLFVILFPIISIVIKTIQNNFFEIFNDPYFIKISAIFLIFPIIFIITEIIEYLLDKKKNYKIPISQNNNNINDASSKIIIHDFRNLLFAISAYIDCGYLTKAKQKIFEIDNKFSEEETIYNNSILSIIAKDLLSSKKAIAKKFNIEFNDSVEIKHNLQINDFDLCSILGNVIDNSIEACKKISNPNKRIINLKINSSADKLYIFIENTAIPTFTLKTSKNNKEYHGIGFKSINKVIDKYNGKASISPQDNSFAVNIMLSSLPENKIYA